MTAQVIHNPLEFGQQLLASGDLDPVYIALYYANLPPKQLQRLCIAYWCYYHLGVAARLSEHTVTFWPQLGLGLSRYPRGTERRHFRGSKAEAAVEELSRRYPRPQELIRYLGGPEGREEDPPNGSLRRPEARGAPGGPPPGLPPPPGSRKAPRGLERPPREVPVSGDIVRSVPVAEVLQRAGTLPLFGPWISFKIADMLERVLGVAVDFSQCRLLELYSEPRKGAELVAKAWKLATPEKALSELTRKLRATPMLCWAPPAYDRICNVQEVETIACKFHSHLHGHYYIGKDLLEVEHGLKQIPSQTGSRLLKALEEHTALPTLRRKTLI